MDQLLELRWEWLHQWQHPGSDLFLSCWGTSVPHCAKKERNYDVSSTARHALLRRTSPCSCQHCLSSMFLEIELIQQKRKRSLEKQLWIQLGLNINHELAEKSLIKLSPGLRWCFSSTKQKMIVPDLWLVNAKWNNHFSTLNLYTTPWHSTFYACCMYYLELALGDATKSWWTNALCPNIML